MEGGTLRYDHNPVLQSILAYGSETQVPDHDVCRLSYYIKCCVVGCGIRMPLVDDALLDYMTAHTLPNHLQELIKRIAFQELSLEKLLNSALILDEQHILLPYGTLNTFYEFKTASTYFTINSVSISSGRQECVHKVMLCTFNWLQEYYIYPFFRQQQEDPLIAALLNTGVSRELQPALNLLLSNRLNLMTGQHQQTQPSQQEERQEQQEGEHQGQTQPPVPNTALSSRNSGNPPPPEATEVQALTDRDAIVPDVPMAVAVPIHEGEFDSGIVEASSAVIL